MDEKDFDIRILKDTQVIVGEDIFGILPSKIFEASSEGAICIVFDKNTKNIAVRAGENLRGLKRKIFMLEFDGEIEEDKSLPEYIRFILAVGCGGAACTADRLAKRLSIDWSLIFTAPTTDTILQGKSPKQVFIDKKIMLNCPYECVAAGIGMIYSQALRSFENIFSSKVLTTNDTKYLPFEIDGELDIVELPCALLELSLAKDNDDSADVVANILLAMDKMGGRRTRLLGEYKFIASSYLLTLYASVLGAPAIDTMLPPCIEDDIEELEKIGCKYMLNRQKSIDFFDVNSYFRINYILSEYRTDLLEQLCSLDTHKAQRTWRRAYADAGFWLKSAITIKDLRHAVRLAGCLSDNFLGYCYASGVLSSDAGTLRLVS